MILSGFCRFCARPAVHLCGSCGHWTCGGCFEMTIGWCGPCTEHQLPFHALPMKGLDLRIPGEQRAKKTVSPRPAAFPQAGRKTGRKQRRLAEENPYVRGMF